MDPQRLPADRLDLRGAGLGGFFFLLVSFLQISMGYTPVEAGAASLPVTLLMLALSARSGALAWLTIATGVLHAPQSAKETGSSKSPRTRARNSAPSAP